MSPVRSSSPGPLWREEIPINAGDERYVTRRQLAKFLVLTSLGMWVGNLWILGRSWLRKETSFPLLAVGRLADVPEGGVKLFAYPTPNDPCILLRLGSGEFVAYSQKCTHLSCAVHYSRDSGRLECPCHEGYFSPEDGRVLQGPPPRPLPRVILERRGDVLIATGIDLGQGPRASAAGAGCAGCPRREA